MFDIKCSRSRCRNIAVSSVSRLAGRNRSVSKYGTSPCCQRSKPIGRPAERQLIQEGIAAFAAIMQYVTSWPRATGFMSRVAAAHAATPAATIATAGPGGYGGAGGGSAGAGAGAGSAAAGAGAGGALAGAAAGAALGAAPSRPRRSGGVRPSEPPAELAADRECEPDRLLDACGRDGCSTGAPPGSGLSRTSIVGAPSPRDPR